jgi:hypothetical protein
MTMQNKGGEKETIISMLKRKGDLENSKFFCLPSKNIHP